MNFFAEASNSNSDTFSKILHEELSDSLKDIDLLSNTAESRLADFKGQPVNFGSLVP